MQRILPMGVALVCLGLAFAPATPPPGVQIGQRYHVVGIRSQFNF